MIHAPTFKAPFGFNAKGRSEEVEQESPEGLTSRAYNVAVCAVGFREDLPEFGITSPLFRNVPLDLAVIQSQVAQWAELDLAVSEHAQGVETAARIIEAQVS